MTQTRRILTAVLLTAGAAVLAAPAASADTTGHDVAVTTPDRTEQPDPATNASRAYTVLTSSVDAVADGITG
ncbi:hypothetical protein [Embleya sp. NBC_00896]|uniref:hypothetical protein n=1 Tax=Embleya sp. NBC_00896 TaxID=2975961 RepID=UPI002F909772|nr:hypothetical protein OG928_37650 [Embleya sp. NBC_00896]